MAPEVQYSGVVPEGTKLFGENMLGIHSIKYDGLKAFFYLFAVQHADGESPGCIKLPIAAHACTTNHR